MQTTPTKEIDLLQDRKGMCYFDPTQPVYDPNSPFGGFFQYHNANDDGTLTVNDLTPNATLNPVAELYNEEVLSLSTLWKCKIGL